jgi:hypothetical protein
MQIKMPKSVCSAAIPGTHGYCAFIFITLGWNVTVPEHSLVHS